MSTPVASAAYLIDLPGLTPYAEALAMMENLAGARSQQAVPDTLMLLEHEPVVTLGTRTDVAEEIPHPAMLEQRGIPIVEVARGGKATYHGPGQLVGTSLHATQDYQAPRYAIPTFILAGNEAQGLPPDYERECDLLVKMPMLGRADSLNVAVATAVMAYEVLNQRRAQ